MTPDFIDDACSNELRGQFCGTCILCDGDMGAFMDETVFPPPAAGPFAASATPPSATNAVGLAEGGVKFLTQTGKGEGEDDAIFRMDCPDWP